MPQRAIQIRPQAGLCRLTPKADLPSGPPHNSLKPWKTTGIPVRTSGTNGLRLTRRAGPQLELAWPAGLPHNRGVSARFRRAASHQKRGTL